MTGDEPSLNKISLFKLLKPCKKVSKPYCFLFIASILLIGCSKQTVTSPTTPIKQPTPGKTIDGPHSNLAQIKERGVLIVGTAITKPFEFFDPDTGELTGFDIDLTNFIARQLGVKVEFVEMSFANLIPALQDGKVDMTIAAMYITSEREEQIDFSDAYLTSGLVMVKHPRLQKNIQRVDDLAGLKIGVKIGSTGAKLAHDLVAQGIDLTVIEYKDTFDSFLDLEVERVDVIFNDYLNTLAYIKNSKSNVIVVIDDSGEAIYLSQVGLGIAVHQGNEELLDQVNSSLIKMDQTGDFQKLYETWLLPEEE